MVMQCSTRLPYQQVCHPPTQKNKMPLKAQAPQNATMIIVKIWPHYSHSKSQRGITTFDDMGFFFFSFFFEINIVFGFREKKLLELEFSILQRFKKKKRFVDIFTKNIR